MPASQTSNNAIYLDFVRRFVDPRTPRFAELRQIAFEDAHPIRKSILDYPRRTDVELGKIITEAAPLARKYKLDQQALVKLLVDIALMANDVAFSSKPSARETRSKIARLQKILRSSTPVLKEIVRDDAACHALRVVSGESIPPLIPSLVLNLLRFVDVLQAASNVPVKLGRGSHAPWRRKATSLCRSFWLEQKDQKPTVYFDVGKRTTEPINPFSCWFCAVMKIADPQVSTSNCYSLLRQK